MREVISAGGTTADADREDPIDAAQSTYAQARSIGANGKHVQERNEGKEEGESKNSP